MSEAVPQPRPTTLTVRHTAPGFCVATHGCLVVVVWGREIEVADLHQLATVQRQVIARYGHTVTLTVIRTQHLGKIPDEVRDASLESMREFAGFALAAATIAEGGGFRMVAFRTVVTGLQLLSWSLLKQKVFDNIGDGVRWLLAQPGVNTRPMDDVDSIIAGAQACADTCAAPG